MTPRAPTLLASFLAALLLGGCTSTPPAPSWHPLPATALAHPLTLDECVSMALSSDVRLAGWQARRAATLSTLRGAGALSDPLLALEWEGLGLLGHPTDLLTKATVGAAFVEPFARPHRMRGARAEREAEEQGLRHERRRLASEVASAWFGLVADRRRERLAEEGVALAQESERLTKAQHDAGASSAFDVERAEAEVMAAGADLEEARSTRREDQLAFAFALGADRPAFPEAREPGDGAAPPPRSGDSLPEDVLASALAGDPAWAAAVAKVRAAEESLHVVQTTGSPLGALSGSVGRTGTSGDRTGAATLDVPLPLFGASAAERSKSLAALAEARAEAERARRETIASLARVWERVRATERRWDEVAHPLSQRLEEIARHARALYKAGEVEHAEAITAERDLRAARRSEVDAWRDARAARYALEAATGLHDATARAAGQNHR